MIGGALAANRAAHTPRQRQVVVVQQAPSYRPPMAPAAPPFPFELNSTGIEAIVYENERW